MARSLGGEEAVSDALRRFGLHTERSGLRGAGQARACHAVSCSNNDTGRQGHGGSSAFQRAYTSFLIPDGAWLRMSRIDTGTVAIWWHPVTRSVTLRNAFECSRYPPFRGASGLPPARRTLSQMAAIPWTRDVESSAYGPG